MEIKKSDKKFRDLGAKVRLITGFTAVYQLGSKLDDVEIDLIKKYSEACGGDPEYVEEILRRVGRPYDINDSTFKSRCMICSALRNYCSC